ncbi:hypothetical protein ACP4OV_029142 [Aristida adscensionis]
MSRIKRRQRRIAPALIGFRRQIRQNENSHCEGSQTLPGGPAVVHNMFHVLARFEDCPRDERTQRVIDPLDLERVKHALSVVIVMFGEGTRLRSISNEIEGRLSGRQNSTELSACQWTAIKGWGQGSSHVLDMWIDGLPAGGVQAPIFFRRFTVMDTATGALRSLNTVSDVIGDEGEFMLLRLLVNAKNHIMDPAARGRLEQQLRQGKIPPIPEPGVEDEEEEEEQEEDI